MTFAELLQALDEAADQLRTAWPHRADLADAVGIAKQRVEWREQERRSMMSVCQKCLKQGASVKTTLNADGESFSCPVHGVL